MIPETGRIRALAAALVSVVVLAAAASSSGVHARGSAWQLNSDQLERDQSLASPAQIGGAAQIYNGRPFQQDVGDFLGGQLLQQQQRTDLFKCTDPNLGLFDRFSIQYNRTFGRGGSSLAERQQLFETTLRRTIMLNRIIQNEVMNASNYQRKPKIANYHFISPLGEDNFALWYADITDCELGLIKKILFDIFDLIDNNDLDIAYAVAHEKSRFLPLFDEDAFEQLANILLVRLYDRFEGDKKMFQLFQWPLYVKKLASFAYNRQQVSQPNFTVKLPLIRYAYPSFFKDLKYNQQAINRTNDNWRAHGEHEKFNKFLSRRISNIHERNRRLAIFRQHWTAINLLNDDKKWNNISLDPDWLRAQQYQPDLYSAKLQQPEDSGAGSSSSSDGQSLFAPSPSESRFKQTSFSDLTDAEFVAYLTNDFSLLENNQESAKFLDANFPIRALNPEFRDEIAAELEIRKLMQLPKLKQQQQQQDQSSSAVLQRRPTWSLARQVVDELISDVGLPIGPASVDNISEQEQYRVFNQIKNLFSKNYQPQAVRGGQISETDLIDEQQRRYEKFKENYGRFKAWFLKENWRVDDNRLISMLRLADMSWQDIKLTLFRICCLTKPVLDELSARNSSIRYLGSNDFMCLPLRHQSGDGISFANNSGNQPRPTEQQQRQVVQSDDQSDKVALELYYYYSVHFNKHHNDMETFKRKFAIFRHNIDRIGWHSCTRGLTLYNSLKMKNFDSLSTIDVLDPRRSYTDDINLDRFKYFTIPDLSSSSTAGRDDSESGFDRLRDSPDRDYSFTSPSRAESSRASISYRREPFFTSVLEQTERQPNYPRKQADSFYNYADRRTLHDQDYIKSAQKYRSLAAHRVYDIVMLGYSDCMKATRGIDVDIDDLTPRQCIADGSLGDQASSGFLMAGGQQNSPYSRRQELERQKDSCSIYWQGLQSWSEGLIKQDTLSAMLIQTARC